MWTYGYAAAPTYLSPNLSTRPMPPPGSPATSYSYPYLPHNPTLAEVDAYNRRAQALVVQQGAETGMRPHPRHRTQSTTSRRSNSLKRDEPQQFLHVQDTPAYHRRSGASTKGHARTGSHSSVQSSRRAPSLSHSHSSEEEEEHGNGAHSGPNTPYSHNVALWRDDIGYDEYEGIPPPPPIPAWAEIPYNSSDFAIPSPSVESTPDTDIPATAAEIEAAYQAIDDITYDFNKHVLSFSFPSLLDFNDGDAPSLRFTDHNKPLMMHKEYLENLLFRLDEIQWYGDEGVRKARKRTVVDVQEQLENLRRMEKMVHDNMHYEKWKRTPRIHLTAPSSSSS